MIEPIRINDNLIYFYWGRYPSHANMDMCLGGGCHVIHHSSEAIVVDTMGMPGQAEWLRQHLERELGISRFAVVNTHWHGDHIGGNHVFADGPIYGHRRTRELMLRDRTRLETGDGDGHPPIKVTPPTVTFDGRLDLWLGDQKIELHEFAIHEQGHIAVLLPAQKTLIAGDMLEDPVCILRFNFAPPAVQLAEFERMLELDVAHIYATHCNPATVKAGGYDKAFIRHMRDYMARMVREAGQAGFDSRPASDFISDALATGELTWWAPYTAVHARNRATVEVLHQPAP